MKEDDRISADQLDEIEAAAKAVDALPCLKVVRLWVQTTLALIAEVRRLRDALNDWCEPCQDKYLDGGAVCKGCKTGQALED